MYFFELCESLLFVCSYTILMYNQSASYRHIYHRSRHAPAFHRPGKTHEDSHTRKPVLCFRPIGYVSMGLYIRTCLNTILVLVISTVNIALFLLPVRTLHLHNSRHKMLTDIQPRQLSDGETAMLYL